MKIDVNLECGKVQILSKRPAMPQKKPYHLPSLVKRKATSSKLDNYNESQLQTISDRGSGVGSERGGRQQLKQNTTTNVKALETKIDHQIKYIEDLKAKQRRNNIILEEVKIHETKMRQEHCKSQHEVTEARVHHQTVTMGAVANRDEHIRLQEEINKLNEDIAAIKQRAVFKSNEALRQHIANLREQIATQQAFISYIECDIVKQ